MPIATNDTSTMEKEAERAAPKVTKAIPPMIAGIAAWYFRSRLRSELLETKTIASNPARGGIITKSPTTLLENPLESDFTS